ncbi:UNVERIFIED_CONTAM: hypothetical protein Slati_4590300 [Sesamum latifolium]|uniref:Uncharacterized protein n=1 Tax=Sesamum latifolium TaxID=2727402 RepID=A0AAW2S2I3_9LAMI
MECPCIIHKIGHPITPVVLHPDAIPYVGCSFTVHINAARMMNSLSVAWSYVLTPTCHNCSSSSINGSKYTSIRRFRLDGLGITIVRNMYSELMHIPRGRLYGVMITDQHE